MQEHFVIERQPDPGNRYFKVSLATCDSGNQQFRGVGTSYRAAYSDAYQKLRMGMDTITESRLRGCLERGDQFPESLRKTCKTGLKLWFAFEEETRQAEGQCPCCHGEGEIQDGHHHDGEPRLLDCPVCLGDEDLDTKYDEAKEEGRV